MPMGLGRHLASASSSAWGLQGDDENEVVPEMALTKRLFEDIPGTPRDECSIPEISPVNKVLAPAGELKT